MARKKTHDEFEQEVKKSAPEYELIGEYVGSKIKIEIECGKGHRYEVRPNDFLNGSRCARCNGNRRKTHEEFALEVTENLPNHRIVGRYVNASTSIEMVCDKGHRYERVPNKILSERSCPQCRRIEKGHTYEQFAKEVNKTAIGYLIVGKYVNVSTKVEMRCSEGHSYSATPSSFLLGNRCPECNRLSKTKTHEQFIREAREFIANGYTIIGTYINNYTPLEVHCSNGHIYHPTPNGILNGNNCLQCIHTHSRKPHDVFVKEAESASRGYKILSTYINTRERVKVKCPEGHIYSTIPNKLLLGAKCRECHRLNRAKDRLTHEEFESDFRSDFSHANNYIFMSRYMGASRNITIKHDCGYIYEVRASTIRIGYGLCPKCNLEQLSKGEIHVHDYLKTNALNYSCQKRFGDLRSDSGLPLSYDFQINDVLIEYHGEQHYNPVNGYNYLGRFNFETQQYHDYLKRQYAKNNGYKFIEIPYRVPFNKIPEFLDHYLEKAKTSTESYLVPQDIIDKLTSYLHDNSSPEQYGEWCLR